MVLKLAGYNRPQISRYFGVSEATIWRRLHPNYREAEGKWKREEAESERQHEAASRHFRGPVKGNGNGETVEGRGDPEGPPADQLLLEMMEKETT